MKTKEEFIQAAKDDEYGEFELGTGDILITDWEGNGLFNPYVIPTSSDKDDDTASADISSSIKDELDINVHGIEWDEGNEVYHVIPENRYL